MNRLAFSLAPLLILIPSCGGSDDVDGLQGLRVAAEVAMHGGFQGTIIKGRDGMVPFDRPIEQGSKTLTRMTCAGVDSLRKAAYTKS